MSAKAEKPENGNRVDLTAPQARALAEIYGRKEEAEKEWRLALTLAGLDPDAVVGGDLEDDLHLIVKEA